MAKLTRSRRPAAGGVSWRGKPAGGADSRHSGREEEDGGYRQHVSTDAHLATGDGNAQGVLSALPRTLETPVGDQRRNSRCEYRTRFPCDVLFGENEGRLPSVHMAGARV